MKLNLNKQLQTERLRVHNNPSTSFDVQSSQYSTDQHGPAKDIDHYGTAPNRAKEKTNEEIWNQNKTTLAPTLLENKGDWFLSIELPYRDSTYKPNTL